MVPGGRSCPPSVQGRQPRLRPGSHPVPADSHTHTRVHTRTDTHILSCLFLPFRPHFLAPSRLLTWAGASKPGGGPTALELEAVCLRGSQRLTLGEKPRTLE